MKGVKSTLPEIIAEVKDRVWDVFTELVSISHPPSYFRELVQKFYASYVVRHNEQKYKLPIAE